MMIAQAETILTQFELLPPEMRYQVLLEIFRRYNVTYEGVMAAIGMEADLSPSGKELFRISMEADDDTDSLMTVEEIDSEIARRRGVARA